MTRPRYGSLKPIKHQIAAGDLSKAEQALLGRHAALLMSLKTNRSPEDQLTIKYRLTLVETKLAVTTSIQGKHDEADDWFRKAREHFTAFDPITEGRLDREEATHLVRKGQSHEALDLLTRVERAFRTILRFQQSSLPASRVELEHAMTRSCMAEAELRLNPFDREAYGTLEDVQPLLRRGNKRRYELDNLMRLIEFSRFFDPYRSTYIARAALINETVVHNPVVRLTLLDATCGPLPLKSLAKRLGVVRD